jgi:hypothetical protein
VIRARHFLTGKNSVLVLSPLSFPSALTLRFVSFGVTYDAIMFAAVVNVYTLGSRIMPALIACTIGCSSVLRIPSNRNQILADSGFGSPTSSKMLNICFVFARKVWNVIALSSL